MNSGTAELLKNPLVLRSAWQRVEAWYQSGEAPPTAEFLYWKVDPMSHLLDLGRALAQNNYSPEAFQLIPYPKKGGMLRHYTRPSVRDQVAFAVFGILLAPLLERQMPNFSFGNRWYRKLVRRFESRLGATQEQLSFSSPAFEIDIKRPRWSFQPFSLSDPTFYKSFQHSHGLFRRTAHWAAAAMLKVDVTDTAATDLPKDKMDFVRESLPPFVYDEWWQGLSSSSSELQGYWVHIDLQLAYPSLNVGYLKDVMADCLSNASELQEGGELRGFGISKELPNAALSGYPANVASLLADEGIRLELASRLTQYLLEVSYVDLEVGGEIPGADGLWLPPHAHQNLPLAGGHQHPGLPTGLSISGMLLNVALLGLDRIMATWLVGQASNGCPSAFLRFADDMIFLTPDLTTLSEGIDAIWEGISYKPSDPAAERPVTALAWPADSATTTNLRVNWSKLDPQPMSKFIGFYLEQHGWTQCGGCGKFVCAPEGRPNNLQRLAQWQEGLDSELEVGLKSGQDRLRFQDLKDALRMTTIRPGRLQPFVTYLVERLSSLGKDTLRDRFDEGTQERLVQLHELVRFDLQDHQVREDTRLAFAANRLSRAWLPERSLQEDLGHLGQVRRSIQIAISKAPWKFSLWRSALRAAVRRSPLGATAQDQSDADAWLKQLLTFIAFGTEASARFGQDDHGPLEWAEDKQTSECWRDHVVGSPGTAHGEELFKLRRGLMLSYLRSAFWRALADTCRDKMLQKLYWIWLQRFQCLPL